MPKSYWTRIQTPNGLKYFRADDVTDELMAKIKDAAGAFYATYIYNGPESGNTSYEDIKAAYDAGKAIYVKYKENVSDIGTELFALVSFIDYTGTPTPTTFNHFRFQTLEQYTGKTIGRFPGNWSKLSDHTFADSESLWSLKNAIAKDFESLDFPVPEGTYCTYGYDLYKANQDVATDTWSDIQWTKVNVMDELEKRGVAYVEILQTPFAEVLSLYNQGKFIVGRSGYEFYSMIGYGVSYDDITSFSFQKISGPVVMTWYVRSDGPSETNNWVTPPNIYYNASIYSIAAPYDETSTYSVGDVVSMNCDLYRCTTDIGVAEPWTYAHWTQTTVNAELKRVESYNKLVVFEVNQAQGMQYPTFNDVNQAVASGKVPILHIVNYNGTSDSPADYFHLVNYSSAPNYHSYSFSNGKEVKTVNSSNTWSSASAYDSTLDEYSTNAVQNATLYAIINDLQTRVAALEGN